MGQIAELFQRVLHAVQPVAERLGPSGLFLLAFCDSSFLSLPEIADALIVVMVIQHPAEWPVIGLMATLGSVAGCYVLYALARKGGEAFLRRQFKEQHIARGLAAFRRHGLLAVVVPSILPPPMPFKIFVLLAGIADVQPATFTLAVAAGRGFRYIGEAWLAYEYGEQATAFIRANLPLVSVCLAALVLVIGVGVILWRRRGAA